MLLHVMNLEVISPCEAQGIAATVHWASRSARMFIMPFRRPQVSFQVRLASKFCPTATYMRARVWTGHSASFLTAARGLVWRRRRRTRRRGGGNHEDAGVWVGIRFLPLATTGRLLFLSNGISRVVGIMGEVAVCLVGSVYDSLDGRAMLVVGWGGTKGGRGGYLRDSEGDLVQVFRGTIRSRGC